MRRMLAIFALWLAGLAVAGWMADELVTRGLRSWFTRDTARRAVTIVETAETEFARLWTESDHGPLRALLQRISRDERIMAVAACSVDGDTVALTEPYPTQDFGCEALATRRATEVGENDVWELSVVLPTGLVHLSTVPVLAERATGFIALVHDLSYALRREQQARTLLGGAFLGVGILATFAALLGVRLAKRGWLHELRDVLLGKERRAEYLPIQRDVQELVDRLANERAVDSDRGRWTPARLKNVLSEHLHNERVLILANREPYIHERGSDGTVHFVHPASGLVTALEPVMRACGGTWIAHGSGSADRDVVDAHDRVYVPPGEESYAIRRVWMSEAEEAGYYYGFANEGLWPLTHLAHTRPNFRTEDWEHYRTINERFARAVVQEADRDDPIILVQDYHFALAPQMIRKLLPRATIITFWHIPWPNAERFGICPWREELLAGLLGSSILGFHTQQHCNNFVESVDRYMESRIDREHQAIVQGPRRTLVRPYPISIEWPVHWLDGIPSSRDCRTSVLTELGLPPDTILGIGIDRLDYTKGIEERLLAVEKLLDREPKMIGRFVFAQLAAPSRTRIPRYQQLNDAVEALAERINTKHGRGDYRPIVLLRAHHEPPTVFRYYRAANLCYVSSIHDGMNLVAKEFVAAREDEQGVLVLSQFTGAARELTEALVVNPYDIDQAASALAVAATMSSEEQRERMRFMRRLVAEFNVYRWAAHMLVDATQLRTRERLWDRWRQPFGTPTRTA